MKRLMNAVFGMLLMVAVGSMPLDGMRSKAKKVEAPIERVTKGVSSLDQIMDQVKLIVEFEDPTSLSHAKKKLISLMNSKALNPKIKDVIKDDIEIITYTTAMSRKASQEAYNRLMVVAKQVEAQANVVAAIEEGAELVKNAPIDEKAEAIKAAQEKIKEAQEEQGWLQYLYTGAKRVITAPVNYVFGQESSKAKTAFYTTVGMAVLAAGAYGVSQSEVASEEVKGSTDSMKNGKELISDIFRKEYQRYWLYWFKGAKQKRYLQYLQGYGKQLYSDGILSYGDMNKIIEESKLVISELCHYLKQWAELMNKSIVMYEAESSSWHKLLDKVSHKASDEVADEAGSFYNMNIKPIKEALINDGIRATEYYAFERKIAGLTYFIPREEEEE